MINIGKMMGRPPKQLSTVGFAEDVVKGCLPNKLGKADRVWRVSSLVQLYKLGCEKLLYNYLVSGRENEFDQEILQTFAIGTKVHDLVKEWFAASPHFKIIHEEWGIKHHYLPITGTMDLVVEWDKYPQEEIIVEIKSSATEYVNNPIYGAKRQPFKANRWQAGIYSEIYSHGKPKKVKAIVLYYDKNNGELIPHLLEETDPEVEKIFSMCDRVWKSELLREKNKERGLSEFNVLGQLNGTCKTKPHKDCFLADMCDLFDEKGKRIK